MILLRKIIVTLSATALLLNVFYLLTDYENYVRFLECVFAKDGRIANHTIAITRISICFICPILVTLIIVNPTFVRRFKRIHLSKLNTTAIFSLASILLLLICWIFLRGYDLLFAEDGLFETLTAAFALATSLLLFKCAFRSRHRSLRITLGLMSLAVFVFALEEISWGQRLFGWQTPIIWTEINYQNETNLHNLLNPVLQLLYPVTSLLLGWLLVSGRHWLVGLNIRGLKNKYRYLFPGSECLLFGSCFLLIGLISAPLYFGELFEEIFAIFGLSYSIRLSKSRQFL